MASQPIVHFTLEEYFRHEREAEQRHEYIDGAILAMAGGTPRHSLITANVTIALGLRLRGKPCRVYSSDLRISTKVKNMIVYPDLSVVCGRPRPIEDDRDTISNPVLIIEILSPSTRNRDRGLKAAEYRDMETLLEFLLIEQDRPSIEHWRKVADGHWDVLTVEQADAVLALESIGVDLPLEEVYAGADGEPE